MFATNKRLTALRDTQERDYWHLHGKIREANIEHEKLQAKHDELLKDFEQVKKEFEALKRMLNFSVCHSMTIPYRSQFSDFFPAQCTNYYSILLPDESRVTTLTKPTEGDYQTNTYPAPKIENVKNKNVKRK